MCKRWSTIAPTKLIGIAEDALVLQKELKNGSKRTLIPVTHNSLLVVLGVITHYIDLAKTKHKQRQAKLPSSKKQNKDNCELTGCGKLITFCQR